MPPEAYIDFGSETIKDSELFGFKHNQKVKIKGYPDQIYYVVGRINGAFYIAKKSFDPKAVSQPRIIPVDPRELDAVDEYEEDLKKAIEDDIKNNLDDKKERLYEDDDGFDLNEVEGVMTKDKDADNMIRGFEFKIGQRVKVKGENTPHYVVGPVSDKELMLSTRPYRRGGRIHGFIRADVSKLKDDSNL